LGTSGFDLIFYHFFTKKIKYPLNPRS